MHIPQRSRKGPGGIWHREKGILKAEHDKDRKITSGEVTHLTVSSMLHSATDFMRTVSGTSRVENLRK
jgi:hypothetical protein